MTQPEVSNEQAKLWNGPSASAWIDAQAVLEDLFRPLEDILVDALPTGPRRRVLDIGCGTGSTTLAFARRLAAEGAGGESVGVDISEPMLGIARARAEREHAAATFITADAQRHSFDPATFDAILSRFGVMFFDDPISAFANVRRAAKPGALLRFLAWRSPAENPFMTTAERAAAPLLPNLPARKPDAPGQFAFADRARVSTILDASGWTAIDLQPIDVPCTFPASELDRYITRLGPVGAALADVDDATRTKVVTALRTAFATYVHGDEVRLTMACWLASARA